MKNMLFVIGALMSLSAFAGVRGHPSEDPVVKKLRERFERGASPSAEDLLNKRFRCMGQSALKGDMSNRYNYSTSFKTHDGIYLQPFKLSKELTMMVDNGKEVIGVHDTDPALYEAIRITEKGDLILEWSVTDIPYKQPLASIADVPEGSMVLGYLVCVAEPK